MTEEKKTIDKEKEKVKEQKGYLVEIFSSYQGEGGSVRGSCFGKRQIFLRLAGCALKCKWCDSNDYRDPKYSTCRVEKIPGSLIFKERENPVSMDFIIEQILSLSTKDIHSIALTGGEPTYQEEFFYLICNRLYDLELPIFLETNGYYPQRIKNIADQISFACVDIKDRSAHSIKESQWGKLVEKEVESLRILGDHSVKSFGKLVVTEETKLADVRLIADKLRELVIPIVIQPVTPIREVKAISTQKLFQITETIAELLPTDLFGLSIQGHKMINVL
jgi:organic radical activating enzyme